MKWRELMITYKSSIGSEGYGACGTGLQVLTRLRGPEIETFVATFTRASSIRKIPFPRAQFRPVLYDWLTQDGPTAFLRAEFFTST